MYICFLDNHILLLPDLRDKKAYRALKDNGDRESYKSNAINPTIMDSGIQP